MYNFCSNGAKSQGIFNFFMNSNSKQLRVAVVQFETQEGEIEQNLARLQKLLRKLKKPTDLIVLPEMYLSGMQVSHAKTLFEKTEQALAWVKAYAKSEGCFVVGSHLSAAPGGFFNTASVVGPTGNKLGEYHKVHLFHLGEEHKKFVAGQYTRVVSTPIGKIGLGICYDIRFPEFVRKEVLAGAEMLIIPSAWPKLRIEHYRTLLRARAIESLCFVISANKVGKNAEGLQYGGHSVVIDPWGKILGELKTTTGILEVKIDLKQVREIRKKFPVFQARRPEIY